MGVLVANISTATESNTTEEWAKESLSVNCNFLL